MEYDVVLGIDLGTSSVKILALQQDGNYYTYSEPLTLLHPKGGYNEQDPEEWVLQTFKAIRTMIQKFQISPATIRAISFSGQMHGLVALGENGQVLRNAILWNDTRSAEEVTEIQSELGEDYVDTTGNRPVEGYVLPKLLWIKQHESNLWQQI
ncbi:FGGY family carbohydrate kinase, partial [Limosilactobacillus fermentum]|uniref:FGGY family carbohydrate kinase n=2 Tax=Lactobacillaceae TaxID=33958 RepID=UPI003363D8FE